MKLNYYPDTDSLYIDLSEHPSVDNASRKVELSQLTLSKLPLTVQTITA